MKNEELPILAPHLMAEPLVANEKLNTTNFMRAIIYFYLLNIFFLCSCNMRPKSQNLPDQHVYSQAFYKKEQRNLKLYSLFKPHYLNVPFEQYSKENKWVQTYLNQTFKGEEDSIYLNENALNALKKFLRETRNIKVFSDYRYKNRGSLLLYGQNNSGTICTNLPYEIAENGEFIQQLKFVPVTYAAHEVYKECGESGNPPILENVSEEDFQFFFKKKCNGLCVERQGIIYQNDLPDNEKRQLIDSLLVFVKSKIEDLKDKEILELKDPKIVVFNDILYVRNQITRYSKNLVLYNICFKKVNDLWVQNSQNETILVLEYIKLAEGEYN